MSTPRDLNGSTSVDQGPSSRRGPPGSLTLESLDERLGHVERHVEDLTGAESSLPEELTNIRRIAAAQSGLIEELTKLTRESVEQGKANGVAIAKLTEVIGESPDSALDKAGTGLRKQVADLVVKSKAPTIVTAIGGAGMGIYAIYQIVKALGIVH